MIINFRAPKNTVPNLVVAQRVLDKMSRAAQAYVQDETGEALVGLIVPGSYTHGVDTVYVLDTIAPNESAVRDLHTFQQGDWDQEEILIWLQENWRAYRESGRDSAGQPLAAKWNVPLRYLGDWHKQPGAMIAPSGGDQYTALTWLDDDENDMDFLIAPIVTLGHPPTAINSGSGANFITMPQQGSEQHLRIDFWYMQRDVGLFQAIVPTIYPNQQLPGLPDYPWHLVNRARADEEFAGLAAEKLFTSIILWQTGETMPLDVCFLTARMGSDRVLILITPWDYPARAPQARVAPFLPIKEGENVGDVFDTMWAASEPVADPPDWEWSELRRLVEYVRALEAALDMAPTPETVPDEGAVSEEQS